MLQQFPGQTIRFPYDISLAGKGVYQISEKHCAKVKTYPAASSDEELNPFLDSIISILESEYRKTKIAFEKGLSVPTPIGVFNVAMRNRGLISRFRDPILLPGYVMDRVYGITLGHIKNKTEHSEACRKWWQEIRKAERLGFVPRDEFWEDNSLWDRKDRKIYLLDLADWEC